MKKIKVVYVLFFFLLVLAFVVPALAEQKAFVKEELKKLVDGNVIENWTRDTAINLPDVATKAEVQAINAKLERKLFGGKVGRGKNAKTIEGAIPALDKKIDAAFGNLGGTIDTVKSEVLLIKKELLAVEGDLVKANQNLKIMNDNVLSKINDFTTSFNEGMMNVASSLSVGIFSIIIILVLLLGFGWIGLRLNNLFSRTNHIAKLVVKNNGTA